MVKIILKPWAHNDIRVAVDSKRALSHEETEELAWGIWSANLERFIAERQAFLFEVKEAIAGKNPMLADSIIGLKYIG